MATGDGNGWVDSASGHRHWGRFGAAGLALLRTAPRPQVLLQLRAGWTHQGGSWGLVGGARDSHESLAEAALREAEEEAGVDSSQVTVLSSLTGVDHGNWSYTYVLALAADGLAVSPVTSESDDLRWVDLDEVPALPLHVGLESTWTALRRSIDAALADHSPAVSGRERREPGRP
jgi:8-oxo-dGTP diphosphatase